MTFAGLTDTRCQASGVSIESRLAFRGAHMESIEAQN